MRYRLPPAALAGLIDARTFDLYDDPMPSLAELETYAMQTSSALIDLAARILRDGKDPGAGDLIGHAGIAYAIAGLLRALPVHAARRQLYVPAEVMQRYGAQAEECSPARPRTELRAALAELRLRARQHLAAARDLAGGRADGNHAGAAAGGAGAAGARSDGAARLSAVHAGGVAAMAAAVDPVARGPQAVAHLQLVGSERSRRLRRS